MPISRLYFERSSFQGQIERTVRLAAAAAAVVNISPPAAG
jgi:hypothetical protein